MRVAIIGAGISGLALAYYLQKLGIAYDLFEATDRVGGNILTLQEHGYLLELGPNTLQRTPELEDLLRELKLEHEVLLAAPANNNRYMLRKSKLQKMPSSPVAFLSPGFFSLETRLRILQEKEIPPANIPNETIAQFFERRFGRKVVDYAIDPFISGIFAGDPEKLLVEKAFPKLKELEQKYGSVLKGLKKEPHIAPQHTFISFNQGMNTLPEAIATKLISLQLEHRVEIITRSQGKYLVSCASSGDHDTEEYDCLVAALPAHQAADLLQYTFPGMAAALHNINYPPMAVVHSVYHRKDVSHPLNGFGALHPRKEHPFAAGSIWSSSLFPGRCKSHEVLITSFVGGSQYATHACAAPAQIKQQVHEELSDKYGIHTEHPVYQHVHLWQHSLPQYDLYIEDAHHMARQLEQEQLFMASNWQAGVSVPSCIRYAKEVAQKINLIRSRPHNS